MKKVAIFVDWDNLRKDILVTQRYNKAFNFDVATQNGFNYNNSKHVVSLLKSFLEKDEEIYRIFFYTAKPKPIEEILKVFKEFTQEKYPEEYASYIKYVSRINIFLESMGASSKPN